MTKHQFENQLDHQLAKDNGLIQKLRREVDRLSRCPDINVENAHPSHFQTANCVIYVALENVAKEFKETSLHDSKLHAKLRNF